MKLKSNSIYKAFVIVLLILQLGILVHFDFEQYFNSAMFESDAASEILLAEQVSKEGFHVLSDNWFYSSEIRVVHNQLIMALVYSLCNNYKIAYALSSVIIMLVACGAVCFLLQGAGINKQNQILGVLMLLVPYGSYQRFSLFAIFLGVGYYASFIILSFLWIGIYIRMISRKMKKVQYRVYFIVIILLSFVMGLCGIRQFILLFVPVIIWEVLNDFGQYCERILSLKSCKLQVSLFFNNKKELIVSVGSAFIGFLIYEYMWLPKYGAHNYFDMRYGTMESIKLQLERIVSAVMRITGYSFDEGNIMSIIGMLNLMTLLYVFCLIGIFIKLLKNKGKKSYIGFLAIQIIFNMTIYLLLRIDDVAGIARYTWLSMAGIVLLPAFYFQDNKITLQKKFIILMCCVGVIFANNIKLICSYDDENILLNQYKENVLSTYQRNASVEQREGYINFLMKNNYTYGYATYWNANISTVLSEGTVRIASVKNDETFSLHKWLTLRDYEDIEQYSPEFVLLLNSEENERIEKGLPIGGIEVYRDDLFVIYDMRQSLYGMDGTIMRVYRADRLCYTDDVTDIFSQSIVMKSGCKQYGPYISLKKGNYQICIVGEQVQNGEVRCTYDSGKNNIEILNLKKEEGCITYCIELTEDCNNVEFILLNNQSEDMVLYYVMLNI